MLAPLKPPILEVDDLRFTVQRSARRSTMQITVDRSGDLVLSAPPEVGEAALRAFVLEKRFWIYTKLAEKYRLQRRVPRKEFVGGEGLRYLGRSHRLRLVRVADYRSRMEVRPAGVKVQNLGYRWCGKGDWLYFHWKAILLPARIAEYVVVHEIAHLHERHHTPAFWPRVERVMPDYAQRKAWLAEHGIAVEGI